MKKVLLTLFLSVSSLATFCSCESKEVIPPKEFQQAIKANPYIQLVDVRTPEEYNEGHIDHARLINIKDTSTFDKEIQSLDKQRPVFIYCRSGKRSQQAALRLSEAGFKVIDLEGGYLNWVKQNLPVEK